MIAAQWIIKFAFLLSLICVSISLILVAFSEWSNAQYCLAIGCLMNRLSVISVENDFAHQINPQNKKVTRNLTYHRGIHLVAFILSCFFGSPLFSLFYGTFVSAIPRPYTITRLIV